MSFRIIADGVEIPYRRETLKIKTESNAFTLQFKANYNKYPFLILKTPEVLKALNIDRINNISRRNTISCIVIDGRNVYQGELILLQILTNTIKVDLKYQTGLLDIVETSIRDFMPVIDTYLEYNGSPSPIGPYQEETTSTADLNNFDPGLVSSLAFVNNPQLYPDVDVVFPPILFPEKFKENADFNPRDSIINETYFNGSGYPLHHNTYFEVDNDNVEVTNRNMVYPCVFLLSALKYPLAAIGYKLTGDFVNDALVKRIFFYSKNNQMTRFPNFNYEYDYDLSSVAFAYSDRFETNVKEVNYSAIPPGNYEVSVKILPQGADVNQMPSLVQYGMGISKRGYYDNFAGEYLYLEYLSINPQEHYNSETGYIEGSYEFEVREGVDNAEGIFWDFVPVIEDQYASSVELKVIRKRNAKPLYLFHPMVELGRFVPDWSFGKFITNLMNLMNVDITIDDVKKEVSIDANTTKLLEGAFVDLSQYDFKVSAPEVASFDTFRLKHKSENSPSVKYGKGGIEESTIDNDRTQIIENEFKYIPSNGSQAFFTSDLEGVDGEGLGLYDNALGGAVLESFDNKSLTMLGSQGIARNRWRTWLRFRINEFIVTVNGALDTVVLQDVISKGKVYLNNQMWLVVSTESQETNTTNQVELKLAAINF